MNPDQLVSRIESLGGSLAIDGELLAYELPITAVSLLPDLRRHKAGVMALLRDRPSIPKMPNGVRLVRWTPKAPPIILTQYSVVVNTRAFVESTLQELDASLRGKTWLAGNRSARELVERLEQVGVHVVLDAQTPMSGPRESLCEIPK